MRQLLIPILALTVFTGCAAGFSDATLLPNQFDASLPPVRVIGYTTGRTCGGGLLGVLVIPPDSSKAYLEALRNVEAEFIQSPLLQNSTGVLLFGLIHWHCVQISGIGVTSETARIPIGRWSPGQWGAAHGVEVQDPGSGQPVGDTGCLFKTRKYLLGGTCFVDGGASDFRELSSTSCFKSRQEAEAAGLHECAR